MKTVKATLVFSSTTVPCSDTATRVSLGTRISSAIRRAALDATARLYRLLRAEDVVAASYTGNAWCDSLEIRLTEHLQARQW
jgi:hypothetical protein